MEESKCQGRCPASQLHLYPGLFDYFNAQRIQAENALNSSLTQLQAQKPVARLGKTRKAHYSVLMQSTTKDIFLCKGENVKILNWHRKMGVSFWFTRKQS